MPGCPGDLLSVGELRKDQLVEGFATIGGWTPAKVLSVDGEGADASATLKFIGFGPRWNQAYKDEDQAIRVRVSKEQRELDNMPAGWKDNMHLRNADGTWPIEKLLGKRRRNGRTEYEVRWKVCLPAFARLLSRAWLASPGAGAQLGIPRPLLRSR